MEQVFYRFTYDRDNRQIGAEDGGLYGYDALGQRVSMMDRSGESEYAYDSLGRIVKVTTGSGQGRQRNRV